MLHPHQRLIMPLCILNQGRAVSFIDALDGEGDQSILGVDLKTLRSGIVVKTRWEDKVEDTASDAWRS